MSKKVVRKIIQDEPTKTDLFHGGGHERTAHSLSRAIVKFDDGDRAIGLDGSWGSGKSSVVEMAARKLKEKNGKGKKTYHFFTFDIWKSQGSGFRRSYLEHFITWAKQTFPKRRAHLEKIENQIQGKTKEIETNNQPILDWYGICVVVFLPFLPIYYFWAKKVFDEAVGADKARDFLTSAPFLLLIFFVAATFLRAWWLFNYSTERSRYQNFKSAISRLLLISSRQLQDQKVVQRVREIDPNDYEFHSTLREILNVVQTDTDRVVVVLDNIDRLPRKEIKEYWALVRSIFSRTQGETSSGKNADITAIVPYDRILIEANVNEDDEVTETDSELTNLASRELFSKTFDEILIVAPPVLSNAREFFADKLEEALPKQVSTDDRFRTYRIFCELLSADGGVTTPRQIVSFVNDLSSLYELQDGKFELPTVAAFIAHQDSLTDNPSILNNEGGLNAKIASLTANPKLVEHLAAMVFNVDEDLAFQILLDDEIASAFVADNAEDLVNISSAPGFDYRVDDVLQDNIDEWRSTGDLKRAIGNASELLVSYTGDAKDYITRAILDGFKKVESISVEEEEHLAYMPVFKLAANGSLNSIVKHYTKAAMESVNAQDSPSYSTGMNVSKFLTVSDGALADHNGHEALQNSLRGQKIPMSPDFVFGLSATIAESGFKLADFGTAIVPKTNTSRTFASMFGGDADPGYFETEFPKYPTQALKTLIQFKECKLLTNDEWISLANACLSECKDEELDEGKAKQLLKIVAQTWQHVVEKKRSEIELDEALKEGAFFRNLDDDGEEAQALLLFLCREKLGETLPNPTELQANGARATDSSDAFVEFNDILEGNADITPSQASLIAVRAIDSFTASGWMGFGGQNPEHKAVRTIVENMFEQDSPPYLKLRYFWEQFSYIRSVVLTETLPDVLKKYAGRVTEDDISKLKISDVPSGFLEATHELCDGHWDTFHSKVDELLHGIDASAWPEHIKAMDATVDVLVEKLGSSGCKLDGGIFRAPYIEVVKGVLAGQTELEASDGALDKLLTAIDDKYHEEIWRTLRETISGVTGNSLANAMILCPKLMSDVAQNGSSISKSEKDNVLRNLLIPALEGRNTRALRIFVEMAYARLKNFQVAAQDGTNKALEAAWNSYSDADVDRDLKRDLSEALFGKRKAKSILDPSLWNPLLK
ncbi:P-loop NTPase fold protein [uncultured Roseibium sp.]|uniref:P-loop NTPase fold protein n=1 Tax=uncultured Roseibium sp. TaxID=1936171 RepID=UPI00262C6BF8|nr:P-loop NTPase fold protein [uncultured Roseibium sp.]